MKFVEFIFELDEFVVVTTTKEIGVVTICARKTWRMVARTNACSLIS